MADLQTTSIEIDFALLEKDKTPAVWPASQGKLHRDRSGVFHAIVPPSIGKSKLG